MCGIAGFSLTTNDINNPETSYWLATGLLLGIENRGRHATGFAYLDEGSGTVRYDKEAKPATEFLEDSDSFAWMTGRQTAILHTRATTKGSASVNENNHPIIVDGVAGVHNGILGNDDEIFTRKGWDRIATVDSEVLFKYLAEEGLRKMVKDVEGDAAIAWLKWRQADPSVLNVASLGGRPVEYAFTTNGGFVFASTKAALEEGAKWAELELVGFEKMADGTAMTVRHGQIVTPPWECGKLKDRYYNSDFSWPYSSGRRSYTPPTTVPTHTYLCEECKERKAACVCDVNGDILAPYPLPGKGDEIGNGYNKWSFLGLPNEYLNGKWVQGVGGYRCGAWAIPHKAYQAWEKATRALIEERKPLKPSVSTIASAEPKTNAEIAEMLATKDNPDDELIVLTFEDYNDDREWDVFATLKPPFTVGVKFEDGRIRLLKADHGQLYTPSEGELNSYTNRSYMRISSFAERMDRAEQDHWGVWHLESGRTSSETLVRPGDLFANSNGLTFLKIRSNATGVATCVTLGPISQVRVVIDDMVHKGELEPGDWEDSDYEIAMDSRFGDGAELRFDWTDGKFSVLYRYLAEIRYFVHYDDEGMEYDWSPCLVDDEDLILSMTCVPTFDKVAAWIGDQWETIERQASSEEKAEVFNEQADQDKDTPANVVLDFPMDMSGQFPFGMLTTGEEN